MYYQLVISAGFSGYIQLMVCFGAMSTDKNMWGCL